MPPMKVTQGPAPHAAAKERRWSSGAVAGAAEARRIGREEDPRPVAVRNPFPIPSSGLRGEEP